MPRKRPPIDDMDYFQTSIDREKERYKQKIYGHFIPDQHIDRREMTNFQVAISNCFGCREQQLIHIGTINDTGKIGSRDPRRRGSEYIGVWYCLQCDVTHFKTNIAPIHAAKGFGDHNVREFCNVNGCDWSSVHYESAFHLVQNIMKYGERKFRSTLSKASPEEVLHAVEALHTSMLERFSNLVLRSEEHKVSNQLLHEKFDQINNPEYRIKNFKLPLLSGGGN